MRIILITLLLGAGLAIGQTFYESVAPVSLGTADGINYYTVISGEGGSTEPYPIPTNGLIAHYKLNGSAFDEISTSNGTWSATAVYTSSVPEIVSSRDGLTNSATTAYTRYITTYNSELLNGLGGCSIMAWVRPSSFAASGGIVCSRGSSVIGILLDYVSPYNRLDCYAASRNARSSESGILTTGTWSHVAITYTNTGTLVVYIDGLSNASASGASGDVSQDDVIKLGLDDFNLSRHFPGDMSQVLIYNRALSPAEIYGIATGEQGPP